MSTKSGGVIVAKRASSRKPYCAMIVPLPEQKKADMEATVAIFLFDPSVRNTSPIELFVSSYGLTRSEAEIAHALVLGGNLEDIAGKRGISRNTAKSHLHAIFAKTETNRQSELVSLLLRSVVGINLRGG